MKRWTLQRQARGYSGNHSPRFSVLNAAKRFTVVRDDGPKPGSSLKLSNSALYSVRL